MSFDKTTHSQQFSPKYSLSHLTLLGCSTPELVYIAARTGYDAISPRLIQMGVEGESQDSPLNKETIKATFKALETTGIEVHDIELARITDNFKVELFKPALEAGAEFGAKKLISSAWTSSRDDREFIIDSYGQICDLANEYGMSVALEFPTFSRLRNLQETIDIVRAADRPNAGILVDTLYMHMSRVALKELKDLPKEWFEFIQVSDISPGVPDTLEGMIQIARDSRLYPGDGCIDFRSILEALPPVNISIELPNRSRINELGYEEHARRSLKATKHSFESVLENA